jgi:hypothetical protein
MGKGGRKYRLLIYEHMLNRWWPMTLLVAVFIFLNVGVLWGAEWYFAKPTDNPLPVLSASGGLVLLAVGMICLLFTLFLLVMRKMAYVQLFDDHIHMATPFLRMNISYKRIQRSLTAQLFSLFPPKSLSAWNRDLIGPVSNNTVIVIHLTAYPLSRAVLRFFLSPFFFYDGTPHFVLFVDDWLRFSTELDSRRSLGRNPRRQPLPTPRRDSGLLDDLKRK